MANQIILSKESIESEIKAYFNAVLKLSQSDNEFPINLDEVWMLVYNRKDYATDALRKDFIENVDYIYTSVKTEVGSTKIDYYLTVSCMEFFIARKVRPVFEVYRKVFHRAAEIDRICQDRKPKREPSLTTKVKVGIEWVKGVSDILRLNDSSKLILLGKVAQPMELPLPDYTPSCGILKSATELIEERGLGGRLTAQQFNKLAIERGFLKNVERNSTHGMKKWYKSITERGSRFGENQVHPNNPRATQPLWYEAKFGELLKEIGFTK